MEEIIFLKFPRGMRSSLKVRVWSFSKDEFTELLVSASKLFSYTGKYFFTANVNGRWASYELTTGVIATRKKSKERYAIEDTMRAVDFHCKTSESLDRNVNYIIEKHGLSENAKFIEAIKKSEQLWKK